MCLNKPVTIPRGTDGASCTVAYASDSSGTNFSYTATSTLIYMSVVCKVGAVSPSDFTTWVKYVGTDGVNGTNGTSITSATLSDGKTTIGGTVYTQGTLVIGYSDGTYTNAGILDCCTLTWTEFTLANGWAGLTDARGNVEKAYYAIDSNGLLHLRGKITASGATNNTFSTDIIGNGITMYSIVSFYNAALTTIVQSQIQMTAAAGHKILNYAAYATWDLGTMPPLYFVV